MGYAIHKAFLKGWKAAREGRMNDDHSYRTMASRRAFKRGWGAFIDGHQSAYDHARQFVANWDRRRVARRKQ